MYIFLLLLTLFEVCTTLYLIEKSTKDKEIKLLMGVLIYSFTIVFAYNCSYSLELTYLRENLLRFFLVIILVFIFSLFAIYFLGTIVGFTLSTIIGTSFCVGNHLKFVQLKVPLVWSDFKNGLVVEVIWDMVLKKYTLFIIVGLLILIASLFLLRKTARMDLHPKKRVICCVITSLSFVVGTKVIGNIEATYAQEMSINFSNDYAKDIGAASYFVYSKSNVLMAEPKNYSQSMMEKIIKKYTEEKKIVKNKKNAKVIYILSEAFSDPTSFSNTKWKEDPMPFIRSIQKEYGGYMYSPIFGGGTANVEFGVTTGFDYSLLNSDQIPYKYISENEERNTSIFSIAKSNKIKTEGIHPFISAGFSRKKVWPTLGIEKSIFSDDIEKMSGIYKYYTERYYSDETFYQTILHEVKENKDNPLLLHTVSMQNHYPYIESSKGPLQKKENLLSNLEDIPNGIELALYARGIKETDDSTKRFFEELKKEKENITVVFYGDHYPTLNESVYESHPVKLMNNKEHNQAHFTPYFVWNNKGEKNDLGKVINSSYLSTVANEKLYQESPAFYSLVGKLEDKLPSFNYLKGKFMDDNGKEIQLTKEQKELLEEYRLIVYDMLVGKQFSKKMFEVR
ncbi:membrane protein [Enterococcus thailandicus]|uniref:LTA synthase family protein n=1 Tax=Enterococcus thailandicus TaxID=417368 RepID=UPI00244D94A0|nr:LTA synthase family protein [Enterococcus thailandicus]GMC02835.1 membrane protein [Enterococcus thailandicus]GMC09999.1 membrane protein [Enterococcus thailandicus]